MPPDASATKARLLQAATEEFTAYGVAGARVDRIAARARANKRLIYVHFGTKEELFDIVVQRQLGVLADAVPFPPADLPGYAGALFDWVAAHAEALRLNAWKQLERPEPATAEMDIYRPTLAALAALPGPGPLPGAAPADVLALVIGLATAWFTASPALRLAAEPPWSPTRLAPTGPQWYAVRPPPSRSNRHALARPRPRRACAAPAPRGQCGARGPGAGTMRICSRTAPCPRHIPPPTCPHRLPAWARCPGGPLAWFRGLWRLGDQRPAGSAPAAERRPAAALARGSPGQAGERVALPFLAGHPDAGEVPPRPLRPERGQVPGLLRHLGHDQQLVQPHRGRRGAVAVDDDPDVMLGVVAVRLAQQELPDLVGAPARASSLLLVTACRCRADAGVVRWSISSGLNRGLNGWPRRERPRRVSLGWVHLDREVVHPVDFRDGCGRCSSSSGRTAQGPFTRPPAGSRPGGAALGQLLPWSEPRLVEDPAVRVEVNRWPPGG